VLTDNPQIEPLTGSANRLYEATNIEPVTGFGPADFTNLQTLNPDGVRLATSQNYKH